MKKISESIIFLCPGCKETFEFDPIGEHEFVPCPMCGTEFMTVKKGQTMQLELFEFDLTESAPLP
jgi:Zn finger protein HypA/HybF involved in hydrogenase expression